MQIEAVDNENNLFKVSEVFPDNFVQEILETDWLRLPWKRSVGQESWARRAIDENSIPWISRWHHHLQQCWHEIADKVGSATEDYSGTTFWLDEPGFVCPLHTDGMMPGSMQLTWIGNEATHGTAFYWYKDVLALRYQFPMIPNCGYLMLNKPNAEHYQKLLWHAMLTPVPPQSFRLTSYSWVKFK